MKASVSIFLVATLAQTGSSFASDKAEWFVDDTCQSAIEDTLEATSATLSSFSQLSSSVVMNHPFVGDFSLGCSPDQFIVLDFSDATIFPDNRWFDTVYLAANAIGLSQDSADRGPRECLSEANAETGLEVTKIDGDAKFICRKYVGKIAQEAHVKIVEYLHDQPEFSVK